MPTIKLTPKEVRLLRKFSTPRVGVDSEYPIVQILVRFGLLKKVTKSGDPDSMVVTESGTAYLAALG